MEIYHQRKVASETNFFGCVWPVVPSVLSGLRILRSLISLEEIQQSGFLHRDSHQANVASANNSFGWVWPVVPLIQSNCKGV